MHDHLPYVVVSELQLDEQADETCSVFKVAERFCSERVCILVSVSERLKEVCEIL